ncbi:MAG: 6-carboxytetrahydropterin synthase QueD [Syntrophales bacterium]
MPGTYEIFVQMEFSAAHFLRGYKGNCAGVHGHNWIVEVFVRCPGLNETGIGIDFRDVRKAVKDVLDELDHADLNAHPAFQTVNPTSENIAAFLYRQLSGRINSDSVRVSRITVSETPGAGVIYSEE